MASYHRRSSLYGARHEDLILIEELLPEGQEILPRREENIYHGSLASATHRAPPESLTDVRLMPHIGLSRGLRSPSCSQRKGLLTPANRHPPREIRRHKSNLVHIPCTSRGDNCQCELRALCNLGKTAR